MWLNNVLKTISDFYNALPRPLMDLIKIVLIILITAGAVKVGSFIIKRVLDKQKTLRNIDVKKVDTMSSLLISIFKYAVYILSGVVILTDVFKMTSVLAAAGVGGIAIGFGAQSLIKDIISGMFIVMEDQYAVGDLITVGDMTGTVEQLELRVTKLRNFNGDLYIIPNGEIKKVINHTRGNRAVIVDVPIAHSVDIDKAFAVAEEVCSDVAKEFDAIVEKPRVLGITELRDRNLNLRIFARTRPDTQGEVERRIRKLIKERFSKEDIAFI
ncbi:MAG TPA: mechanosensitive ion channel family protein [Clostridiaceae bacterium]|nr:mechanosensitive ion channel family protein [Clostridiaceae bacterium]